ncbi:MAG: F0F1 ATP synthase subunit beta, partial [Paracoccaceae bacterium]
MGTPQDTDGSVIAVRGAVVDIGFADGDLPPINDAVMIEHGDGPGLLVEVQAHIDETSVRAIAMQATAGLKRGSPARRTGAAITMPVGDA